MSNIKRIGIVLAALVLVAVVMASFKGSDVLDRAIILGVGIDKSENGLKLTAEVVSPGNGQEQVGTFSKTVTAEGQTVGEAMQNVAEKTGKEASLGQCVVLILGQELYETEDFTAITDYFINHHSFKESAVMCCCEGKAEKLFNNSDALSQGVSLSVAAMLLDEAKKIGVTTNSLLQFARSQGELDQTGFLNKIKFNPSENKDAQDPDKTQGYFTFRELAVFRNNVFVCELGEDEVKGLSLFIKKTEGESFVSELDGVKFTLQVNNKDIKQELKGDEVEINISLSVRLARTDSEEATGAIAAKKKKEIDTKMLDDVQKQATELAELYLKKQAEYNFDLIKLHEMARQKEGASKELAEKPTADFIIKLKLEVKEN